MVPSSDDTAVVSVDRILRAPDQMQSLAGREVTVRLRQPVKDGDHAVFSTNGWLYGESIAVVEVGDRASTAAFAAVSMEDDRHARWSSALQLRSQSADMIVVGRVRSLEPAAEVAHHEHSPQWWSATVAVQEVLKGRRPRGGTVQVLFANSQDVLWHRTPVLTPGQQVTLLLHRGEERAPDKRSYTLLDEMDVQGADVAADVASLL